MSMSWHLLLALLLLSAAAPALAQGSECRAALAGTDHARALRECIEAAKSGDQRAALATGLLYAGRAGGAQSDEDAVKWFRQAADGGNAYAQFNLGVMHHTGRGVARSTEEAARWYLKSAEQGLAQAQNDLGAMYLIQSGVRYDHRAGIGWLTKAADRGHPIAQFNLACALLMGGATAYVGSSPGFLGPRMGISGTIFAKDEAAAASWLQKAAEQGHVIAQFNLGLLYDKGSGVARNHAEAVKWYRKAVEAGLIPAFINLAVLYESGIDIPKDPATATQLRMKSSRAGQHRAHEFPILMLQYGAGTTLDAADVASGATRPEKEDLLMRFIPQFSIDPELHPEPRPAPSRGSG